MCRAVEGKCLLPSLRERGNGTYNCSPALSYEGALHINPARYLWLTRYHDRSRRLKTRNWHLSQIKRTFQSYKTFLNSVGSVEKNHPAGCMPWRYRSDSGQHEAVGMLVCEQSCFNMLWLALSERAWFSPRNVSFSPGGTSSCCLWYHLYC